MASTINTTNIDTTFPVAGQDNDSQGFRDNFTNTNTNFESAKEEIEDLQNKAILKSALTGTTLDNDFSGALISNAQIQGIRSTVENTGTVAASASIDLALAPYHKIIATEPLTLSFTGWTVAGTHSAVQVEIDITNVSYTVTLPAAVTIGITGIQGIASQIITFPTVGTYILEFATTDFGATISVNDLTPTVGEDLGEFTIANLPVAATYPNCRALATDASGGRTVVRSDGTNWKVVAVEGATVSV